MGRHPFRANGLGALPLALVGGIALYPLLLVFLRSVGGLFPFDKLTISPYVEVISQKGFIQAAKRSLLLSLWVSTASAIFGSLLAWIIEKTDVRYKRAFKTTIFLGFASPPLYHGSVLGLALRKTKRHLFTFRSRLGVVSSFLPVRLFRGFERFETMRSIGGRGCSNGRGKRVSHSFEDHSPGALSRFVLYAAILVRENACKFRGRRIIGFANEAIRVDYLLIPFFVRVAI